MALDPRERESPDLIASKNYVIPLRKLDEYHNLLDFICWNVMPLVRVGDLPDGIYSIGYISLWGFIGRVIFYPCQNIFIVRVEDCWVTMGHI